MKKFKLHYTMQNIVTVEAESKLEAEELFVDVDLLGDGSIVGDNCVIGECTLDKVEEV